MWGLAWKSPANGLCTLGKAMFFFEVIPNVLGHSVNFNITKFSIKTAHFSRLSVSCDYVFWNFTNFAEVNYTWPKLINDNLIIFSGKDRINPIELFVEKHQFSNQNNQWLNNISLKLVSTIFYEIFIFHQMIL